MSLLAQRALATLVATGVVQFSDGQSGIGRDAVVACLGSLLRERGFSAKQSNDRIAHALRSAPRIYGPGAQGNFISLDGLQRVCRLLGLQPPQLTFEVEDGECDGGSDSARRGAIADEGAASAASAAAVVAHGSQSSDLDQLQISSDEDEADAGAASSETGAVQAAKPQPVAVLGAAATAGPVAVRQTGAVARSAQEFLQLEKHDLARLCLKQQRQLQGKNIRIRQLMNELSRAKRESKKTGTLLARKSSVEADPFIIRKLGRQHDGRGGRLSLPSMFSIGLRRSLTHVAAGDFGILAMADISQQTVIRIGGQIMILIFVVNLSDQNRTGYE